MAKLSKRQLRDLIAASISGSGWGLLYLSGANEHPFRLLVYREGESYPVKMYVWNISHGGGARRPADEYRIQITGVDQFEPEAGSDRARTLILGYWDDHEVFAGFDVRKHVGHLGFSPSMQIRQHYLVDALANGFAFCPKDNGEVAVAFRPDLMGDYIRDWTALHDLGATPDILPVVTGAVQTTVAGGVPDLAGMPARRQTAVRMVTEKVRDAGFRKRVIAAYEHRCAFCGVQMDLIDAAHIVPVGHPQSTDETTNGVSLCALHHRAFDKSLVTFDHRWRIRVSNREVNRLRQAGHDGGLPEFRTGLRDVIVLPADPMLRPRADYLNLANTHRGW